MNTLVVMGFLKSSIKEEEHIDKSIRHRNMSFFWQKKQSTAINSAFNPSRDNFKYGGDRGI